MRGVNRLRKSSWLLPAVLAALVLRALIPAGFMPGAAGPSMVAVMCSFPDRTELIEIAQGDTGATMESHCDFCLAPMLGATPCFAILVARDVPADSPLPVFEDPVSRHALARAQIPRAPPLA